MPRTPSWTALLAGLALACGPREPDVPEPPRPANLADFDPRAVSRIEDALAKVQAGGGEGVTPKTPIPGMGAFARTADTEGNVIGLFEGACARP